MINRPTVIVAGAGIGGLTAAHELSRRGFEVVVYERNKILGGLARSSYYTNAEGTYPTEYSWRVYGTGYRNLLRLLREIPLRANPKNSVFENLVKVSTYLFPRFNKKEVVVRKGGSKAKLIEEFERNDLKIILEKTFFCLTASDKRLNAMEHIRWQDFCKDLSPEAKKYMIQMWGPVLGMDATYMSVPVVSRMVGILLGALGGYTSSLFLMNKPTNEAWFDEWSAYLEAQGVIIKNEHEIQNLKLKAGKVDALVVKDKNDATFEARADYYVCGLSVETVARIALENKELARVSELKNTIALARIGKQIQLSVQLFLNQKLSYPTSEKIVLYLPDTPWSLIIEPEELAWGKTYCTDPRVKTVLSVGICQTDAPGIVYDKPFTKCTPEEIKNEIWAQLLKSYQHSNIKTESGNSLDSVKVILFYLWDSFQFDRKSKTITIWEPKFSNNAGSLRYQPNTVTAIPNLFFSTAYTKTDRFIYSVEAAVEAGARAANAIMQYHNKKYGANYRLATIFPLQRTPWFLKPLVWLDILSYKLGLPHLSKLTFNSSIMFVCIYVSTAILAAGWLVYRIYPQFK